MKLSLDLREITFVNRNFLLAIIAAAGVFCAIAKDLDIIPHNLGISFGYSNSGLHFLGAGIMGFLAFIFNRNNIVLKGIRIPKYVVLVIFLSIVEETTQIFRPNRGFSFVDMAANILGIIVFSLLAKLFVKLKLIIR